MVLNTYTLLLNHFATGLLVVLLLDVRKQVVALWLLDRGELRGHLVDEVAFAFLFFDQLRGHGITIYTALTV